MDNFYRGNNTLEHWNEKHHSYGTIDKPYEEVAPQNWETILLADQGCTIALVKENNHAIQRKSLLDIGCAHGTMLWYLKEKIIPSWDITGMDFSNFIIESNKSRYNKVTWAQRDILLNPLDQDFGIITCLQTIEHFAEGDNYKFLDNTLEHCEYLILATVDTKDDCFGEHISHYDIDIMDRKGYNVLWKNKLQEIQMPDGIYHYIIFLIKGKL